jgi:hypothetical protein
MRQRRASADRSFSKKTRSSIQSPEPGQAEPRGRDDEIFRGEQGTRGAWNRAKRWNPSIGLGDNPIIQSITRRSSLIDKGHFPIGKVLTNMIEQVLYTIRHAQRFKESLMICESHRDASFVDIESRKHIVVPRDKCLASHRSASLIQWLQFQPLYLLLGTRGAPRHPSYKSQDRLEP